MERPLHDSAVRVVHISKHVVLSQLTYFYVLNWPRRTLNSVSFTCTCLSVSKNGAIVALKTSVSNWLCYLVENRDLICVFVPNIVKLECLLIFALRSQTYKFYGLVINMNRVDTIRVFPLFQVLWSDPYSHPDTIRLINRDRILHPMLTAAMRLQKHPLVFIIRSLRLRLNLDPGVNFLGLGC